MMFHLPPRYCILRCPTQEVSSFTRPTWYISGLFGVPIDWPSRTSIEIDLEGKAAAGKRET